VAETPEKPRDDLIQLLAWLSSITTWKRAFIILMLGGALLIATLIYQHPEQLFDVLDAAMQEQHCGSAHLYMSPLYSDAQREMNRLEKNLGPAMIGVVAWRVDLDTNRQKMVAYAVVDDYRDIADQIAKQRWQDEVPLFGTNPVVNDLLGSIIAGRFACADAAQAWPALRRFPLAEVCLIAIPPFQGSALSGFIGGGWRDPIPSTDEQLRIEGAFRTAASALVWRTRSP
jgi:hypothetical protein